MEVRQYASIVYCKMTSTMLPKFGGVGWENITCWMDDETDDQIRPEYVRQQSHTSL